MKLITGIAALALVAGSMDVEAQKRGKVGLPGDSDDDAPQITPVAHLAIGAFSQLDPEERKDLAEAAEEGDEEALEELRAEHVEAIEAMIEALQDEDAREMIKLGAMLAGFWASGGDEISFIVKHGSDYTDAVPQRGVANQDGENGLTGSVTNSLAAGDGAALDKMLDGVGEQLEAALTGFLVGNKIQIIK
jgi:hypothetical protein